MRFAGKVLLFVVVFLVGLAAGSVLFDAEPALLPDPPTPPVTGERPDGSTEAGWESRAEEPSEGSGTRPRERKPPKTVGLNTGRAGVLKAIRDDFERRDVGKFPTDLEEAVLAEAEEMAGRIPSWSGGWLAGYIRRREAVGMLGSPPEILLQARGSVTVDLFAAENRYQKRDLAEEPLDVVTPLAPGEKRRTFVRGGVVPYGKVLVLDHLEVTGHIGHIIPADARVSHPRRVSGVLDIEVNNREVFEQKGVDLPIEGKLFGPFKIGHLATKPLELRVSHSVAAIRGVGRILSKAEAAKIRTGKARWGPTGTDGFLKSGRVLLQVLADHGGGNPNTVRLDGTKNMYLDQLSTSDLWDDSLNLRKIDDARAYCEGTGVVPPGVVFRITRIDYRARLDREGGGHSDFIVKVGREVVVKTTAKEGTDPSGSWSGEIDITPGDEDDVTVTCSYYAMGEAIIWGTLIEP